MSAIIKPTRNWIDDLKKQKHINIVTSPDLDGYISALLLSNRFNTTIVGFYNNRELLIKDGIKPKDCIFIDCDVLHPNIRSVGHHITDRDETNKASYNKEGIQINNFFGVSLESRLPKADFSFKYPFSTFILLSWILDITHSKFTKWQKFLMLQADGVFNVVSNYSHSTAKWDEIMGGIVDSLYGKYGVKDIINHQGKYRDIRKKSMGLETNGQGKGTEKIKRLVNSFNQSTKQFDPKQLDFIKAIGEEIGYTYTSKKWDCCNDMNLYNFNSYEKKSTAKKFFSDTTNSDTTLSFIYSNSGGKLNYTKCTTNQIEIFG
jgi:hypothetical protein